VQEAAGVRGDRGVQFGECKGRFPRGITPFPFYGAEYAAVKDWDGIGGEMVVARKWQAAAGKPRGTETKAVNPGKAKLIAAVDKKVGENSDKIAQKLIDVALASDWTGAKLLFALADGQINCEDPVVMSQLCSYAEGLKSERQLTGDEVVAEEKKLDEAAG
jgi:hypothetical protein